MMNQQAYLLFYRQVPYFVALPEPEVEHLSEAASCAAGSFAAASCAPAHSLLSIHAPMAAVLSSAVAASNSAALTSSPEEMLVTECPRRPKSPPLQFSKLPYAERPTLALWNDDRTPLRSLPEVAGDAVLSHSRVDLMRRPLTHEEEQRVASALRLSRTSRDDLVIVRLGRNRMTRKDASTLGPEMWLNDEIINCYGNLLLQRHKYISELRKRSREEHIASGIGNLPPPEISPVHVFDSFFWTRLQVKTTHREKKPVSKYSPSFFLSQSNGYCYANVKKWTGRTLSGFVNLFICSCVIVFINIPNAHWLLAAIFPLHRVIAVVDSVGEGDPHIFDILLQYLKDDYMDKFSCELPEAATWRQVRVPSPRQHNTYDCGIFMLMNADLFLASEPLDGFSQQDTLVLRKNVLLRLLDRTLTS